jgi:hypothetical protein
VSTDTQEIRRKMLPQVNAVTRDDSGKEREAADVRADLEARYGQVYNTSEMSEAFEALGFAAPLVVVRRKSDGMMGSLMFCHAPRYYFNFQPHNG